MLPRLFPLVLFSALTSCAAPEAEILTQTETYFPTATVEILLDSPKRPHKTFAVLEDRNGGKPEEINARLARKAEQIGADAIVITGINDKSVTDWQRVDPYYGVHGYHYPRYRPVKYTYRSVRAKAIKYLK